MYISKEWSRGRGWGLSFVSFHWTAMSRLPALMVAGGRSLSWLPGPGVKGWGGGGARAASSWCWLSGFSSGAAASPSPSGPRPAPSWLGTAPLSSIRSPPPAARSDKAEEQRPQGGDNELQYAIHWWVKLSKRSRWTTVEAKSCISNNRKKNHPFINPPNVHLCLCIPRVPGVLEPSCPAAKTGL